MKLSKWEEWNGHALDYMAGRRKNKDRPSSIEWLKVASTWSQEFVLFALTLKDPRADAYMVRVLQYVATHSAGTGEITIPRDLFGPAVLSTHWDPVSQETGGRVWDAMHLHGICTSPDVHPGKTGGTGGLVEEETPPPPAAAAPSPSPTTEDGKGKAKKRRDLRDPVEVRLAEKGIFVDGFRGAGLRWWRKQFKRYRAAGASDDEQVECFVGASAIDGKPWDIFAPLEGKHGGSQAPKGKYAHLGKRASTEGSAS